MGGLRNPDIYFRTFRPAWEQPILKAKEGNIYKLPDCITEGYPMVFTLSEDGQTLVNWDLQATGYKHATYGMVYFLLPTCNVKAISCYSQCVELLL